MILSIRQLEKEKQESNYILKYKEWGGVVTYYKYYSDPQKILKYIKRLEQECFCSYLIIKR